jgi:ribosomal protein S18 acetylase RimI-like enzyme
MASTTSSLSVRELRPADVAAVIDLTEAAMAEFRGPMGDAFYAGYLAEVLDVERRARVGTVLVAELDGDIVGTITVYANAADEGLPVPLPDGAAGIRATFVHPATRGRGVGSELVRAAIARARAPGATWVVLHSATCMVAAIRLYERVGFRRASDLDFRANDFFADGAGDPLEVVGFVLALA